MSVVAVSEPVQLQMDFFMQSEECLCQWYSEASSESDNPTSHQILESLLARCRLHLL